MSHSRYRRLVHSPDSLIRRQRDDRAASGGAVDGTRDVVSLMVRLDHDHRVAQAQLGMGDTALLIPELDDLLEPDDAAIATR